MILAKSGTDSIFHHFGTTSRVVATTMDHYLLNNLYNVDWEKVRHIIDYTWN